MSTNSRLASAVHIMSFVAFAGDEGMGWPNLQRCDRRRWAGSQQNESRGGGTRRRPKICL